MPITKGKNVRGVHITVYSSIDGNTEETSIGTHNNLRHWVKMKNLTPYRAEINCQAWIPHPTPVVQFDSGEQGDTAAFWTASHPALLPRKEESFSHVFLRPTASSVGSRKHENIHTYIEVYLAEPGRTGNNSFVIMVSV